MSGVTLYRGPPKAALLERLAIYGHQNNNLMVTTFRYSRKVDCFYGIMYFARLKYPTS